MPDTAPTPNRSDGDSADSAATQRRLLESIRRWLKGLTVAGVLMALALFLLAAAEFGNIVEYHAYEPLLVASTAVGTAVLGFFFGFVVGWFVRRK